MNKRPYKKKTPGFPITHSDWYDFIRNLPSGCFWVLIVLIVAAAIKQTFFP